MKRFHPHLLLLFTNLALFLPQKFAIALPSNHGNSKKKKPGLLAIPNPFAKKPKTKLESFTHKISEVTTTATHSHNKPKRSMITVDVLQYILQNLLAGLASAIALVPEASTFAITAGLNPLVGLGSTVTLSIISGLLGGRPGLVSGATATVSMILKPLSEISGVEHPHLLQSLTVLLAGIIQLGLGSTKCAKYIRVVPKPVMMGFVNGLSIKVVLAQIPHFQHPHGVWLEGAALKWHSILVLGAAIIIDFFPKYVTTAIPSSLLAMGLAAGISQYWNLPVPRLVDMVGPEAFQGGFHALQQALFPFYSSREATAGGSSSSIFPPFGTVLTPENLALVLPIAIEMAVVGLLQSLLTVQIIDSKTHTRGRNNKESIAQGVANVVSGSMGGMGGSALLGQSLVNVNSGGTGRLSSISVAIFVTGGITFFAPLLGQLPVAALIGLMLTVAQHTFSWGLLQDICKGKVPWSDVLIIGSVMWTTAFVNMAAAVGVGVLASALRFAWQASCNMSAQESDCFAATVRRRYIRVQGPLFFGSTTTFEKLCKPSTKDREAAAKYRARVARRRLKKKNSETAVIMPTGRETVIDFSESQVWDHSAIMAIEGLALQYHEMGVKLRLRGLSSDCREKLFESSKIGQLSTEVDVDSANDPTYLVGEDPKYTIRNNYNYSKYAAGQPLQCRQTTCIKLQLLGAYKLLDIQASPGKAPFCYS